MDNNTKTISFEFTPEQADKFAPFHERIFSGEMGSILAQVVISNGGAAIIRAIYITREQAQAIQRITGTAENAMYEGQTLDDILRHDR